MLLLLATSLPYKFTDSMALQPCSFPGQPLGPPSRSHKVTEVASSAAFFNPSDKQADTSCVLQDEGLVCLGYIRPSQWGNEKLQGTAGHWRSGPNAASGTETKSEFSLVVISVDQSC